MVGRVDDRVRNAVVAGADMVAWPLAVLFAAAVERASAPAARLWELALAGAVAQLVFGVGTHLYRRRFQALSFEELGMLGLTYGVSGFAVLAADRALGTTGAFGHACVLATSAALSLALFHRYLRRLRARYVMFHRVGDRRPVLVLGAGEGGYRAVRAMLGNVHGPYRPVALLDDDPNKANTRISRVRVRGTSADLESVARHFGATAVVLAMPSARPETLRRLHHAAERAGLETLVLPPVQRLVGVGSTSEITRYNEEDVLRRRIVEIDPAAVRHLVEGRVVLVTGAGGSIGSEIARQLARLGPDRLVLLDHDDSLLHAVSASIPKAHHDRCRFELADIRDPDRLAQIFVSHQPDVVFHAAALKHVPALEQAPAEGWKTNVIGTANVLAAAQRCGVQQFVNISTDKAAEPCNVLGYTKRVAERLTASAARLTGYGYVSVRFGNVIGSRGSVLETFERQIAAGGPVTVTDPGVTRYFMAVREAVQLTLQAAAIGSGGEVLVLDMGTPVAIVDVARQLIEQRGGGITIEFCGLRPGEKMHEVLLAPGEFSKRKVHPMIDHVNVPPIDLRRAVLAAVGRWCVPTDPDRMAMIAGHDLDASAETLRPARDYGFDLSPASSQ